MAHHYHFLDQLFDLFIVKYIKESFGGQNDLLESKRGLLRERQWPVLQWEKTGWMQMQGIQL